MVCGGRTRSVYNPPHTSGVSGRVIENEEGIGNSNLVGLDTAGDPPDPTKLTTMLGYVFCNPRECEKMHHSLTECWFFVSEGPPKVNFVLSFLIRLASGWPAGRPASGRPLAGQLAAGLRPA